MANISANLSRDVQYSPTVVRGLSPVMSIMQLTGKWFRCADKKYKRHLVSLCERRSASHCDKSTAVPLKARPFVLERRSHQLRVPAARPSKTRSPWFRGCWRKQQRANMEKHAGIARRTVVTRPQAEGQYRVSRSGIYRHGH
jgi:hypothetical protein